MENDLTAPTPYGIDLEPLDGRVAAVVDGVTVADTTAAVLMRETYLPPVLYLPRADVANGVLQRSERRTFCPFEGTAAYWSLKLANQTIENAVFEYERPLSAARSVGGQVAFSAGVVDHWLADDALLRAITAADWPTRLERPDAEGRR